MRLRLLSRGSDLARLQTDLVAQVLRLRHPGLVVDQATRSAAGDRDRHAPLWQAPEKGFFTRDLSQALVAGEADVVVHSWKDLPVEAPAGTTVAATLERADPRDVLLLRADVLASRPPSLRVLTSSPRRTYQLAESLAPLLPWRVACVEAVPVRGNIPTRLNVLDRGPAHGLVVAKAALDRLLSSAVRADVVSRLRAVLSHCAWMVLPIREFPTAPAQGALALEVADGRADVKKLLLSISHEPTRQAVETERAILARHGGGCHESIGATVLDRPVGVITSVRGRSPSGQRLEEWSIAPRASVTAMPSETRPVEPVSVLDGVDDDRCWWINRADVLPSTVLPSASHTVWASDSQTWRDLAARGVWVHGCADGLGRSEAPDIDVLAGRSMTVCHLATDVLQGAMPCMPHR